MAKIKWTKDNVIEAVNEAYESLGIGQKPQPVINKLNIANLFRRNKPTVLSKPEPPRSKLPRLE